MKTLLNVNKYLWYSMVITSIDEKKIILLFSDFFTERILMAFHWNLVSHPIRFFQSLPKVLIIIPVKQCRVISLKICVLHLTNVAFLGSAESSFLPVGCCYGIQWWILKMRSSKRRKWTGVNWLFLWMYTVIFEFTALMFPGKFFLVKSSHLRWLSKTLVRSHDFRVSEHALFGFLVVHRESPVLPTMHFRCKWFVISSSQSPADVYPDLKRSTATCPR